MRQRQTSRPDPSCGQPMLRTALFVSLLAALAVPMVEASRSEMLAPQADPAPCAGQISAWSPSGPIFSWMASYRMPAFSPVLSGSGRSMRRCRRRTAHPR